ncbi:MAG: peptidoglycan-binding protein, partial [Methanobrevibacter sp.]|nr:peptidoglycan-binding protein [Methanobrevibacter sp.]
YQKWADGILEAAKKNEDLNKALEGVSFNDTTLKNMLADGASMAKMSKKEAEQYFTAMNSLYLMFQSGDYDLEDLLPSIQRVAAASHFEGEIKVGDDKILISHGYVLEMNKDGNYVSAGGKEFKNAKDASAYLALTELGIEEDQIIEQQVGKTEAITYSSTMTLGKTTITVRSSSDGLEYFTPDGNGPYKSVDALIAAEVKRVRESGNFDEGMSDQEIISELGYNYTIHPTITADTDKLELSKTQVSNLVGKTLTELKEEFGKGEHEEEFVLKYGFTLTGNETEADLDNLKELQGIESKNVELTLSVNTGDDEEIVNLLNTTPATKEVTLTVTDIDYGGLNNDPTNPNPNTPKINLSDTTNGLESIRSIINEITAIDWTNFNNLSDILTTIITQVEKIATAVQTFANQTFTVELNQTGTGTVNIDSTTDTSSIFDLVSSLDSAAQAVISNIQKVIDALSKMETTADGLNKLADALTKITETRAKITTIATTLSTFSSRIDSIRRSLDRIPTGTKSLSVKFNYSTSKSSAKGNVALAKGAEQPALAKGIPTLMGELGPELVVSRGHYFVVGQAGAEFVNLDKDAIVFNHKQTKRLLQNGSIGSRGVPFTNEANALSFAKGNYPLFGSAAVTPSSPSLNKKRPEAINDFGDGGTTETYERPSISTNNIIKTVKETISSVRVSPTSHTIPLYSYAKGNAGPAMASASAALAQLKQIRAMWQSMLDASAKELGSLAGGSGGGKKGGGGGGDDWQQKTTNAEIQRWYNLIRQIAKLEEDITYQESLQAKLMSDRVANGKAVYKSYKQELALLQQEIGANQELAALQKSWYDAKRADLAASDYGKIFTYDENGLQQYVGTGAPGTGLGLDILENLTRQDVYGQAIGNAATAEAQLAYLRSVGFNTENLRYNEDGTLIKFEELEGEELDNAYVQMMENFWSNLDGWRDELDSIYDSYHEQLEKVLSNQDKQNEIFQKIVDNQLSVENDVLEALEAREQKRIDDAQDERDALSESADKFLKGLTDQLSKEREMYQRNSDQDDLNKLRRQLAILQRSGGAASQIRSLQDQINSKTQDAYFTAQQDQIDAIKEASDAQLERLDTQIDLMTETLEYQKENGLLWAEVYEVMARTPAEIQDFIINNTPDFQSNSALQVAEDVRDLKLRIEQWTEYRDDVNSGNNPMTTYSNTWDTFYNSQKNLFGNIDSATLKKAKNKYESTLAETGDPNEAAQAADKILNQYRKVNASAISNMSSAGSPSAGLYNGSGVNSGVGGAASVNEKVSTIEGMLRKGDKGDDVRKLQAALNKLGYTDGSGNTLAEDGIFGSNTKAALEKFQSAMGIAADGILGPDTKGKFALKGYSRGGIADYTGLAMLHGTPENPEGILNANQMKMWKQDMDMREQLLPTLLATYNNMLQNNSNRNFGTTENTGTVIEHIDLNLNVQELSNDYDARRAADTIMERLMDV